MSTQAEPSLRDEAVALDEADELAGFRERFVIPDDSVIYLDGNSLGRLPRTTLERLNQVVRDEWGADLIRSWERRWLDLPATVGEIIGTALLGARPGEVIVSDSTTVNFYKLAVAAIRARPDRSVIVTDRDNFPTDRYVIEGIAAEQDRSIRWIEDIHVEGPQPEDVAALLDEDVALVTLSHVAYRTAAIADMREINRLAHEQGALVLWDLCHAAGAIPVDLTGDEADLAVGCTYKYLNGGPGAPAFCYVRKELQPLIRQPIWGWIGRVELFEMAQGYEPVPGIGAQLTGTPTVLPLVAVQEGATMLAEAGTDALRAKGVRLTEYAVRLYDALLAPIGFTLGSPRDPSRRGSHVLVEHPAARRLCGELVERGVVPDFRQPNGIRLGLAPLTTTFTEVYDGITLLADLAPA